MTGFATPSSVILFLIKVVMGDVCLGTELHIELLQPGLRLLALHTRNERKEVFEQESMLLYRMTHCEAETETNKQCAVAGG